MKKDGKYRFSLQFSADSEEQIKAGELLERLSNKKSQIIVASLNEYMAAHPELVDEDCKIEVKFTPEYTLEQLEQIVKTIVESKLAGLTSSMDNNEISENTPNELDFDITQMLENLDLFE